MGDLVSQSRIHVQRSAVSPLIDVPTFLFRLKEIAANTKNSHEAAFADVFMQAWENSEDRDIGMRAEAAPPSKAAAGFEIAAAEPASADQPDTEE